MKVIALLMLATALPTFSQQQSVTQISQETEIENSQEQVLTSQFRIGKAKGVWLSLIRAHVPIFSSEARSITPGLMRKVEKDISSILSTEGYFSPTIQFEKKGKNEEVVEVHIDAGIRTTIKELHINIIGNLNDEINQGNEKAIARRDEIMKAWPLTKGAPFKDADWTQAKAGLMENLHANQYAGASLIDSRAAIDTETHTAVLDLDIDSGPVYYFGELNIEGLERYPLWLIDRFNPPKKQEVYSKDRLTEFQNALQNSAYFSSVNFIVEPDASKAESLPISVVLTERKTRDIGFSTGYSTTAGFRGEVSYRDRNLFDQVWDLKSAVRLEQKRQLAYAEVYLPPARRNRLDSIGVLVDRLDAAGLIQSRVGLGVSRVTTIGLLEQRIGLNYTQEKVYEKTEENSLLNYQKNTKALVGIAGWTWRAVDDILNPTHGHRAQIDLAFSEKSFISDQGFFSVYGKYQYWLPMSEKNTLLMRAEYGQIFSKAADGIPENFLFRTGGSTTVRGYKYQTLGVKQGQAIVGGRVLGTASIEYIRWLEPQLGMAVFYDAGDAAKSWQDWKPKQGFGIGARLKTLVGPIALDTSYGRQSKKIRLDFSIAIAF